MSVKSNPKIALIGNPNSGKSSLFNQLTGLSQKVGNFPGVTVEKRSGNCRLDEYINAKIIDLPGTYSIYARCAEEKVTIDILGHPAHEDFPDILVFIADAAHLKRNLLLFSQVKDLGVPVVLALNMQDLAAQAGIKVDVEKLHKELNVQVVPINARSGEGLKDLKYTLSNPVKKLCSPLYDVAPMATKIIAEVKEKFNIQHNYQAYQFIQQGHFSTVLKAEEKDLLKKLKEQHHFRSADLQAKETNGRYQLINQVIKRCTTYKPSGLGLWLAKVDKWLTHQSWGYAFFFALLFVFFQLIFALGNYPMHQLDQGFAWLSSQLQELLPEGMINSLLSRGIIPALAGVLVFIPHLLVFYTIVTLLEESGYMSRVILLMDRFMRLFGLTGRSAAPLLSNAACGVPAVMACKSCSSWREKISGIFVTPLVNCSNRLPVYIILIALFIPYQTLGGIVNLQGLVLLGMYFFSFFAAVLSSWLLKLFTKRQEQDYLRMELPYFTTPYWKDILKIVTNSVTGFSRHAIRSLIPVSILFWALLNFGPSSATEDSTQASTPVLQGEIPMSQALENPAPGLEGSYASHIGNFIEPMIRPLGFDWQIGLAVMSSFVAREAFVGSLATIYSHEVDTPSYSIIERIESHLNPHTKDSPYALATVISLLVFYAFAMQYFNLLGRLLRNGASWWAPLVQLVYMTGLAYLSAFSVYNILT